MQLFISYAHDDINLVRPIVEILITGGNTVWFDQQLLPGQDWKAELARNIAASHIFLVAVSRSTLDSEWCQWELSTGVGLHKPVVPILIRSGVMLPDSLAGLQYADFTNGVNATSTAKLMGTLLWTQRVPAAKSLPVPSNPRGIPSRAWENAGHWTDFLTEKHFGAANLSEEVVGKFSANRVYDAWKSVGGRLILTNQRLLFESSKLEKKTD